MNRIEFANMAQRAVCKTGLSGAWWNVKWNDDELVIFRGIKYVPWEYGLWFDSNGTPRHAAILHDLKSNSIVRAGMDEIEMVADDLGIKIYE